jgi:hypothetical protein
VFEAYSRLRVSLKAKISASDLHRLLNDVRRRVEYEFTFEGNERRIRYTPFTAFCPCPDCISSFTSTLLPPTTETLRHVLIQGGIPPRSALAHDPMFDALLAETRMHLASGSFDHVLEVCLDRATEILFAGVEKNVFAHSTDDPNASVGPSQEPRVRLAGLLPPLARWCHLALEGLPNELIDVRLSVCAWENVARLTLVSGFGKHARGCSAVHYSVYELRGPFAIVILSCFIYIVLHIYTLLPAYIRPIALWPND